MTRKREVVVIGGGQAGLSTSYYLSKADYDHVVLERDRVGERWRSERWDSFTLVTPNFGNRLPGYSYQECDRVPDDPGVFLTREEVVAFLEGYADHFDPPLRCGVEATRVRETDSGFAVETSAGTYESNNVVVAVGTYQQPRIPAFNVDVPPSIRQLHSSRYQNPDQLPDGSVLVVGSGQSGGQIAQELHESGRDVFLSVSGANKLPRRYRGKDIIEWMDSMGRGTVEDLDSLADRFGPNSLVSGKDGGQEIDLLDLAADGMTLFGKTDGIEDGHLVFSDDLEENLQSAYRAYNERLDSVDDYIEAEGIDAPAPDLERPNPDDVSVDTDRRLGLEKVRTIVWATGYQWDFSWVEPAGIDEWGFPIHDRGVAETPGLYFVGLDWLYSRKSGFIRGVGDDARYIAEHMTGSTIPDE